MADNISHLKSASGNLRRELKILCYLQSEKIWVVVLQNYYRFAKSKQLHWIAGRPNISVNKFFFLILDVAFAIFFLCYFQNLQLLVIKKFEIIFAALYFYLYELKKCLRFLKSYFKLEILSFCLSECLF